MKLVNETNGVLLAVRVYTAGSFTGRLIGLMMKKNMPRGSGLILKPCNSIHTFFMRFGIDAVFINKQGVVVKVMENLPACKFCAPVKGAHSVIELPAGTTRGMVLPGNRLVLIE